MVDACLVSVISSRDVWRIPSLVNHYERLGITEFHLAVHRLGNASGANTVLNIDHGADVSIRLTHVQSLWSFELQRDLITQLRLNSRKTFAIIVDADEYVVSRQPIGNLLDQMENEHLDVTYGYLLDQIAQVPRNGQNSSSPMRGTVSPNFPEQPFVSPVTWLLLNAPAQKAAIVRKGVQTSIGQHSAMTHLVNREYLQMRHFKWMADSLQNLGTVTEALSLSPYATDPATKNYLIETGKARTLLKDGHILETVRKAGLPVWKSSEGHFEDIVGFDGLAEAMRDWRPKHGLPPLWRVHELIRPPSPNR